MRYIINMFLVAGFVLFCYAAPTFAQFPSTPKARPAVTAQTEQPYMPSPPVVNVPAPPVVTMPAPASSDFFNYIWATLGTLATLIFGKMAFLPAGTKFKGIELTPEVRAMIDQVAIKAVESGAPGAAVKAGLGLIPGVGGLASLGEPMLQKLVLEGLNARLAQNQGGTVPQTISVPTVFTPAPQIDNLANFAEMVADKIKARMGVPS